MKKIFNRLRRDQSFYLNLLAPLILGMSLIYIVTDIIYSGGRRENMAAIAEGYLIAKTLEHADYDARNRGEVIVVSASDEDYEQRERARSQVLKDLSINEYALLARRVAQMHPKLVVVNWLYFAHEESAAGLEPFLRELSDLPNRQDVVLAFPTKTIHAVPEEIGAQLNVKEGNDCIYEVNSFCTYNRSWDNWLIQYIANKLWLDIKPFHISDNLPHKLPNFVLHLPRASSIPTYSFRQVFAGDLSEEDIKGRVVFIGNDVSQASQFADSKYLIDRTYTSASDLEANLIEEGVPFHVFWAQMAQMFVDNETIAVPSRFYVSSVLVILSIIIFISLVKVGPVASFGTFLFYVLLYPLANVILMRYFHGYMPMFDMIYGGFITFVSTSFIIVSYTNYQNWRAEDREKGFESTADLKGNFISLISHNLNTPIAKLQGLADIIVDEQQRSVPVFRDLHKMIGKMQVCVRSVLYNSTISQNALLIKEETFGSLVEDIGFSLNGVFKRFGLEGTIDVAHGRDEPEFFKKMSFDTRIVDHLIVAMLAQFPEAKGGVGVLFEIFEDRFLVSISFDDFRGDTNDRGFYFQSLNRYIQAAIRLYEGEYKVKAGSEGTFVQVSLKYEAAESV